MNNIEKWKELNGKLADAMEAENESEYEKVNVEIAKLEKQFTKSDWQYMLDHAGCVQAKIYYEKKLKSIDN